jgi:hypothetical protein
MKTLVKNGATIMNAFYAGDIMSTNGLSSSNDIEMVLQAFVENKKQYFTPTPINPPSSNEYDSRSCLSTAIKNPYIIYRYTEESTGEVSYYWYDRNSDNYIPLGDEMNVEKYLIGIGYLEVENET